MPPRLVRIDIATRDIAAATSAWKRSLGITSQHDGVLRVGKVDLYLKVGAIGELEGLSGLVLEVEDLDATVTRLVKAGAVIAAGESPPDGDLQVDLHPESTFGVRIRLRAAPDPT